MLRSVSRIVLLLRGLNLCTGDFLSLVPTFGLTTDRMLLVQYTYTLTGSICVFDAQQQVGRETTNLPWTSSLNIYLVGFRSYGSPITAMDTFVSRLFLRECRIECEVGQVKVLLVRQLQV